MSHPLARQALAVAAIARTTAPPGKTPISASGYAALAKRAEADGRFEAAEALFRMAAAKAIPGALAEHYRSLADRSATLNRR